MAWGGHLHQLRLLVVVLALEAIAGSLPITADTGLAFTVVFFVLDMAAGNNRVNVALIRDIWEHQLAGGAPMLHGARIDESLDVTLVTRCFRYVFA